MADVCSLNMSTYMQNGGWPWVKTKPTSQNLTPYKIWGWGLVLRWIRATVLHR